MLARVGSVLLAWLGVVGRDKEQREDVSNCDSKRLRRRSDSGRYHSFVLAKPLAGKLPWGTAEEWLADCCKSLPD